MESGHFWPLIAVSLLILASAFFSAAETALTAASRAKIYKLKTNGNKRAILVTKLRSNKEKMIGSILLGNTAVNIFASSIATSIAISSYGEESGVLYSTILMTVLTVVCAEVLPKTYAVYNSVSVSLKVAPALLFFIKISTPFTKMVQIIVNILLKVFGGKHRPEMISPIDELRGTIELHHREGKVVKPDRDMLGSILDLSETEVGDIMVHRKNIYSIDVDKPTAEIIKFVLESEYTRIPLWKDTTDNIVGLLHAKALLKALKEHDGIVENLKIMEIAKEPWFVPETNMLSNQLLQFREKRNHMAFVVDEYGDLVGLVTLEDILEEIVGQIDDEHDKVSTGIKKLKSGSYRIRGDINIRDINRQLDWKLPDEEAATIAGLLINQAEYIPDVGQEFRFFGFRFKILKKNNNQITSVLVKKISKVTAK